MIENDGFINLTTCLEPRYEIPSRKIFTENILPDLYATVKFNIQILLLNNNAISFTVDI